jgi:hypothetical protein
LEACRSLVPKGERGENFKMIFKHCADHGCVSANVMFKLCKLCPDLYRHLTNQDPRRKPNMKAVPAEWQRNARDRSYSERKLKRQ